MRESCISHAPRQIIAVLRQDYYELTNRDCVAAALLSVLEYWTNGAIAQNPEIKDPWVGERKISDFEEMLVGVSTDKQIRIRLKNLENLGYIETRQPKSYRKTLEYRLAIEKLQSDLDSQAKIELQKPTVKQPLETAKANGQMTVEPTVKQPLETAKANGQMTVALISSIDLKKEEEKKEASDSQQPFFSFPEQIKILDRPEEVTPQTISLVEASLSREEEKVPPVDNLPEGSVLPRNWNSSMSWLAVEITEFTSKMEFDELRQRRGWLPGWRSRWNITGVNGDFLAYIQNTYLPSTPSYREPGSRSPDIYDARSWVSSRDVKADSYWQVFNIYQKFQEAQAAKQKAEQRQLAIATPADQGYGPPPPGYRASIEETIRRARGLAFTADQAKGVAS